MTREEMIQTSKTLTVEKLLECYEMHAVIIATSDSAENKARATMANEVIKAELISRMK